jgi:hypothetical protein
MSSIGITPIFNPSADELIAVSALMSLSAACEEESRPVPVKSHVQTIQSEIFALSALFVCLRTCSGSSKDT